MLIARIAFPPISDLYKFNVAAVAVGAQILNVAALGE
jgi:hypothetical protein